MHLLTKVSLLALKGKDIYFHLEQEVRRESASVHLTGSTVAVLRTDIFPSPCSTALPWSPLSLVQLPFGHRRL